MYRLRAHGRQQSGGGECTPPGHEATHHSSVRAVPVLSCPCPFLACVAAPLHTTNALQDKGWMRVYFKVVSDTFFLLEVSCEGNHLPRDFV